MTVRYLIPCFLFAAVLNAAPVITSIQNPASNILPGLPNFGIAQGQIFVLYGTELGPSALVQATALPLPTTLAGTTVRITPAGSTTPVDAPVVYTLNTQLAAVMPSNVAVGAGATVQVTYNGVAGNSFTTRIVDSNFGISTLNQSGSGGAVLTYPTPTAPFYGIVGRTNSAIPGTTYTMWGTGLGPANSDNNIATNGDLKTDIRVFVGGIEATVTYRGRSGGPGLDQINFTIPLGVSGCSVSLTVQTNTTPARVSNAPTIPVAANGGACTDPGEPSGAVIEAALARGSLTLGGVSLDGDGKEALGFFLRFNSAQTAALLSRPGQVSPGSCATSIYAGSGGSGQSGGGGDGDFLLNSTGLDAGTTLSLAPPAGSAVVMSKVQPGFYVGGLTGLAAGAYRLSNAGGGTDIGAFSLSLNGPPSFTWTNSNIRNVTRSQGMTITWAGGNATSTVNISGVANGFQTVNGQQVPTNTSVQFYCLAPASVGSFTVPASILLALPGVSGATIPNGNVWVYLESSTLVTIPGTDFGLAAWNTATVNADVIYQ